jgi:hypothetical protein
LQAGQDFALKDAGDIVRQNMLKPLVLVSRDDALTAIFEAEMALQLDNSVEPVRSERSLQPGKDFVHA